MSGFLGTKTILIQPSAENVTYGFQVTTKTSSTATEGFLAFETTVSGVDVTAYKTADVNNRELTGGEITVADLVQGEPSVSDNLISVMMSYPSTNKCGYYKLTMVLTISDGSKDELDFSRIIVKNK